MQHAAFMVEFSRRKLSKGEATIVILEEGFYLPTDPLYSN